MRFAAIYGNGAVLGFTPQQVNEMSMWQYMTAMDGYIKANSTEEPGKLSTKETDELWDWLNGEGGS